MKVFELINELACFKGGQEVFHVGDGVLSVAGKPEITIPSGTVAEPKARFASEQAGAAFLESGLTFEGLEGHEPSGATGFTVADIAGIVAAAAPVKVKQGDPVEPKAAD